MIVAPTSKLISTTPVSRPSDCPANRPSPSFGWACEPSHWQASTRVNRATEAEFAISDRPDGESPVVPIGGIGAFGAWISERLTATSPGCRSWSDTPARAQEARDQRQQQGHQERMIAEERPALLP